SWTTAPISEVTTPIRRGNGGRGRFRAGSNRPSAANFFLVRWYAAQKAPTPAGVAARTSSCTGPFRGNTSTSPDTTTSMPSSRSNPKSSASSRKSVHETWAVASFNVKKTWPADAVWRLLTSPRTRMRLRSGFVRTVSRMSRASCETVIAAGTPGLGSHGTAIGSIIGETQTRRYEWMLRGGGRKCTDRSLRPVEQVLGREKCVKSDADLGEQQLAAFLAVDDADALVDHGPVSAEPFDRAPERATGRDDVLDEEDPVPAIELPFELLSRPVLLRGFAHHDVRLAAGQAHRGGNGDRAQLDARDPVGVARERRHAVRDRPQQVRSRDRPLDIYVVLRGPAAGKREC